MSDTIAGMSTLFLNSPLTFGCSKYNNTYEQRLEFLSELSYAHLVPATFLAYYTSVVRIISDWPLLVIATRLILGLCLGYSTKGGMAIYTSQAR